LHREFRSLLDSATGVHEFIIALNADIRGFSTFCREVQDPQAVLVIKKIYKKLIDEYFPDASFFKPTGDGLLIAMTCTETNAEQVIPQALITSLRVLKDFPKFCEGEAMIRFKVPQRIGIGLSMGPACRIVAEDKTLDYCGRVLNLASRLMDLARPSGVVFDQSLDVTLLPPELVQSFSQDRVYIRGVAEEDPIDVYHTPDTQIDDRSRRPLREAREKKMTLTFREIRQSLKVAPNIRCTLPSEPKAADQIEVWIKCPAMASGRRLKGSTNIPVHNFRYRSVGGTPCVLINTKNLVHHLKIARIKDRHKVEIRVHYGEK
jgi:hypothetical protein